MEMGRRGGVFSALLATGLVVTSAGAPLAAPAERPFPVDRTQILREEGVVYTVEGRVRIPRGIQITCSRDVHIVGKGQDATIVVEGRLTVVGVEDKEVVFEGVTIEPAPVFEEIRLDRCVLRGGACVKNAKDEPVSGDVQIELTDVLQGAVVDLVMAGGTVKLFQLNCMNPVVVRAVDPPDGPPNRVQVEVRNCDQTRGGFRGGLVVEGARVVIVRDNAFGGALVAIRDWRESLTFDANLVESERLEFRQPVAGRFRKADFSKCDVSSERIVFAAPPAKAGVTEEADVARWWFRGITDAKEIHAKTVEDAADDPTGNGVRAKLDKPAERPHGLAGAPRR